MNISGGKALVKTLGKFGIKYVMGVPGGQSFQIYQGIVEEPEIQHIMFRCERCAVFAADAYARISCRPGVCDAVAGPGVANMIPGVAEAWGASIPIIAITSDIHSWMSDKNAMLECDQMALLKPFVKKSFNIIHVQRIPETLRKAFRIACSGRPGPININIPADVLEAEIDFNNQIYAIQEFEKFPAMRTAPDPVKIKESIDLISKSKLPVMFAGGGAVTSQAFNEVAEFAELLGIPIITSIMGKGIIPEDHPLSLGVGAAICVGGFRTYYLSAYEILSKADLIIYIGCKTDQYSTANWSIPSNKRIIQIDIDPQEIGRNFDVNVAVVGDAKIALQLIIDGLKTKFQKKSLRNFPITNLIRTLKQNKEISLKMNSDEIPVSPHRVIKEIQEFLGKDGILIADASLSSFWGGIFYSVRSSGRVFIAPRGFGGLGFGLPATIGAKIAAPKKQVLGIGGDFSFMYSLHELETADRIGISLVYMILNDVGMGWVEKDFCMSGGKPVSLEVKPLDYAKIAEDFNCLGLSVERPGEIKDALKEAFNSGRPAIIDIRTKSELPVGGKSLN